MSKRHSLKVGAVLCLASLMLFALAGTVSAEVEVMSLADLIGKASTILQGKVSKAEAHWNKDQTMIYTSVSVSVGSYLKGGTAAGDVTIEVPGGTVGEITLWVSDTPAFEEGQEVILFLREEAFQIVGWFQGKFTVVDDMVVEKRVPVDQFTGYVRAVMQGAPPSPDLSYSWVSDTYETPTDSEVDWVSGDDETQIDPVVDWANGTNEAPVDPAADWVSGINEDSTAAEGHAETVREFSATRYTGAVATLAAETCPPTMSDFYGGIKWVQLLSFTTADLLKSS